MTKRALVLLAILGLTILFAALVALYAPLRSSVAVPVGAASPDIEREYATEQDWLVATIVRAAAGLAQYARQPGQPVAEPAVRVQTTGPGTVAFALVAGGQTVQDSLVLSPFVWSPSPYAGLARRLLAGTPDARSTPASWGVEMLRRLHDPRTEVLQAENARVSEALTAAPTDAALHEQAALILAVLALKEHADRFHDVRVALGRMAAHLAIASALRPEGVERAAEGLVAESVLLAIVGRQTEAMSVAGRLATRLPAEVVTPWVRAARLRASGDWRRARRDRSATLLERLEYFRAARERLGTSAILEILDEDEPEPIADWARAIMEQRTSVGTGNRFAERAVDAELVEAGTVLASFGHQEADEAGLVARLNDPPAGPIVPAGGGAGIQVIDWGLWAAFFQRHFLVAANALMHHYRKMLGLPEEANAVEARLEPLLERLTLFPLLARARAADEPTYDASMPGGVSLCATRAELVTPANWRLMLERPAFANRSWPVPKDEDWFSPSLPFGCVMEVTPRMAGPYCWRALSVPQLARMRTVAPYDSDLAWHYLIEKFTDKADAATIRSVYGPLLEYDAGAMNALGTLRKGDPSDYIPMARRMCDLLPDTCATLGRYLADHGRDEEAAAVYEDYIARARDEVGVSNKTWWLARYYVGTGQADRAVQLARRAADTGSEGGLHLLGEMLDRAGRLDEAERCYRQTVERYNNRLPLLAFLLRHRNDPGVNRYRDEAKRLVGEVFPAGLQPAKASVLSEAPTSGIKLVRVGYRAAQAGLRLDDVIVALDGLRVANLRQYHMVWALGWSSDVTMTVWRDGGYQDLRMHLPQRSIDVDWNDYGRGR